MKRRDTPLPPALERPPLHEVTTDVAAEREDEGEVERRGDQHEPALARPGHRRLEVRGPQGEDDDQDHQRDDDERRGDRRPQALHPVELALHLTLEEAELMERLVGDHDPRRPG